MKIHRPNGRCNISGNVIQKMREQANMSQEQLAANLQINGLDLTQKAISRIETGARIVPDYELPYFAKTFDVTVDKLLCIEN